MSVDETRIAARGIGGERRDAVADEGVNAGCWRGGPCSPQSSSEDIYVQ